MNPGVHGGRAGTAHAHFRKWLSRRFSRFTVAGLVVDDAPVLLWQIYVPLALTPSALDDDASEEALAAGRPIEAWIADPLPRRESPTPKGVREPQEPYGEGAPRPARTLLVSGPAGSGKTTLVSSIAAIVARGGDGPLARRFSRWLPVPLVLRDHDLDAVDSLDALVARVFAEAKALDPALEVEHLYRYLDAGEAALMLDGLDEVGSLERRRKVARWLVGHRWVVGDAENPGCAVLVTARPSGFEGLDDELRPLGALRLHVAPFSWAQIEGFLKKWFALRPITEDERRESTAALVRRLKDEPAMTELRRLCRRPAYLTALAFVQGTRGALPHSRVVLFEQIVDAYVDVLDRHRRVLSQHLGERVPFWDHDEKRAVLAEFAWRAQSGAWPEETEGIVDARRLQWTRAAMAREVEGIIARRAGAWRTLKPGDGAALAEYFLQRTGLFAEPREGMVQFGHLVFQEFLTALYLVERAGAARDKGAYLEKNLLARVGSPGWFEVARLALALDDRRTAGLGHRVVLPRFDLARQPIAALACALALSEEIQWVPWERRLWRLLCLLASRGEEWAAPSDLRRGVAADEPRLPHVAIDHLAESIDLRDFVLAQSRLSVEQSAPEHSDDDSDSYPLDLLRMVESSLPDDASTNRLAALLLRDAASTPAVRQHALENRWKLAAAAPSLGVPTPTLPSFWLAALSFADIAEVTQAAAASCRLGWMTADLTGNFLGSVCCRWWSHPSRRAEVSEMVHWRTRKHEETRLAFFSGLAACAAQSNVLTELERMFPAISCVAHEWARCSATTGDELLHPYAPRHWHMTIFGEFHEHDWDLGLATINLVPIVSLQLSELSALISLVFAKREGRSTTREALIFIRASEAQRNAMLRPLWASLCSLFAPTTHVRRAELVALRARMDDPLAMAAGLASEDDRAAATAEWSELLSSDASPIPFLDFALSLPWNALEIAPRALEAAFLEHYDRLRG